jgi:hypothetical protein
MDGAKRVGRLVVHHDADDRHEGTLVIGAETDSAPAPPLSSSGDAAASSCGLRLRLAR